MYKSNNRYFRLLLRQHYEYDPELLEWLDDVVAELSDRFQSESVEKIRDLDEFVVDQFGEHSDTEAAACIVKVWQRYSDYVRVLAVQDTKGMFHCAKINMIERTVYIDLEAHEDPSFIEYEVFRRG